MVSTEAAGRQVAVTVKSFSENTLAQAKTMGPSDIDVQELSLEEIFVALVGRSEVLA